MLHLCVVLKDDREFQGLSEPCVVSTFGDDAQIAELSLLEHRSDWDQNGFTGYATDITLRSGLELVISEARSENFVRLPTDGSPTELIFILSRGTGGSAIVDGKRHRIGGGTLEVSKVKRTITMASEFAPGSHNEYVVLRLAPQLMCELLDIDTLPTQIREVLSGDEAFKRAVLPMNVELFRLLDELLHCATEGTARQLYFEGKALETLARIYEAFHKEPKCPVGALPSGDVARLQRAKDALLEKLDAPPTIEELSKRVGLNQTKLKEDFRTLFGSPIYAYLRDRRMTVAHRLLEEGNLNVTEVATKVGYANASKFASAFKKHFGVAPSEVRSGGR